jgi:hypothetical protein
MGWCIQPRSLRLSPLLLTASLHVVPPCVVLPHTGDRGKLTVGILPVAHFCSGHAYFVQRLYDYLQIQPFAVHATFQFSGTPGKRHRFREAQLWDEKHEYFQKLGEWCGQEHGL